MSTRSAAPLGTQAEASVPRIVSLAARLRTQASDLVQHNDFFWRLRQLISYEMYMTSLAGLI